MGGEAAARNAVRRFPCLLPVVSPEPAALRRVRRPGQHPERVNQMGNLAKLWSGH